MLEKAESWDHHLQYPTLESAELWRGAVFALQQDVVQLPGGAPVVRQFLDHGGAVAVVALRETDSEPEILLQSQYRHPAHSVLWEIPAGLLDVPGEEPLQAAKRELREEADLGAHRWQTLVDIFTSPGASTESLRIFLASELYEHPEPFPRTEEEALMESRWVPLAAAVAAVMSGAIHSPTAVSGILATYVQRTNNLAPLRAPDADWFRST